VGQVEEPEDLIALPVAAAAARRYAEAVLGFEPAQAAKLTADSLKSCLADKPSVWDATVKAFGEAFPDEHIEKAGFAREVVRALEIVGEAPAEDQFDNAVETTRVNFSHLLGHLADLLRDARATEDDARSATGSADSYGASSTTIPTASLATRHASSFGKSERRSKTRTKVTRGVQNSPAYAGSTDSIPSRLSRFPTISASRRS
jgi:hypothetical protein